jgi:hypothetical protein
MSKSTSSFSCEVNPPWVAHKCRTVCHSLSGLDTALWNQCCSHTQTRGWVSLTADHGQCLTASQCWDLHIDFAESWSRVWSYHAIINTQAQKSNPCQIFMQNTIIPGIKSLKNLSQPSRLQISLHIVFSPCQIGQNENLRPLGELLWLVSASKSVHTTANRADSSKRKHIYLLSDNRKRSFLFDVDRMFSQSQSDSVFWVQIWEQ